MSENRQIPTGAPKTGSRSFARARTGGHRPHRGAVPPPGFVQRNRKGILAGIGLSVLLGAVLILVLRGNKETPSAPIATTSDAAILEAVSSVPGATFDAVGAGRTSNAPQTITSASATGPSAKPEVLYIGAEYCPFCAAERWAMVLALSRFGTFKDLKTTRSSASDVYPNTATFSFDGATYTSDYILFTGVETNSNQRAGSGYSPLQKLTDAQSQIFARYSKDGGIPFVYFGGKYVLNGGTYDPAMLSGFDWSRIIRQFPDTLTPQSQAIIGSANQITATICHLTDDKPAEVCRSRGVLEAGAGIAK